MTVFQKIACLIFRLAGMGFIGYACLRGCSMSFSVMILGMMPLPWPLLLVPVVLGVILYLAAKPLAWLVTQGFEE